MIQVRRGQGSDRGQIKVRTMPAKQSILQIKLTAVPSLSMLTCTLAVKG